ncbi:acylglycerol kinase family protein [Erythrobacter sp. SCSIO 43205]|uniref:diacylglycerol/lipid kinase family protein n=1 Tax=Erythrobacter sp. SCSIO 43205 TaxID=2779361 RepID=UPI001CA8F1E0|nr:acylglycerol kinase family protein [Erythrobacter sp. SCSIO 43205]UAB78383.1 acylglycerol kinase family protein [Erythrobacter sp. SCSIO 43205]
MVPPIHQFAELPLDATPAPSAAGAPRIRARGEAPRVGVIYNPRSHGNKGVDFDCDQSPQVHFAKPGDREQLPEALADFARRGIDLLVINGGDGTVRDVLTSGAAIFGENWPAVAVLPKGKTNALTFDLGVPTGWTLQEAIDAFDAGTRVRRRPLEVTPLGKTQKSRLLGFILGAGAFTTATSAGQSAHKLGAFNSMAVVVASVLGVCQWLFATRENPWRKGSKMRIGLGREDAALEHSGIGDPEWRQIVLASTLEQLPGGVTPFGKVRDGLKLAVTDQISRKSAGIVLQMLRGKAPENIRDKGFHQVSTSQFTLRIEDSFIVDGEAFPPGDYLIAQGPELEFVAP